LTTTKNVSISVWRVSVAVTMQAPLSTVGVQVAMAEVALGTKFGCTIVHANESERAMVPLGQATSNWERTTV